MAISNTSTKQTSDNGTGALWRSVLSDHQREEAAYRRVEEEYSAACAAFDAECPTEAQDKFEALELRFTRDDRDQLIRDAEIRIVMRDFKGRSTVLSPDELAAVTHEAATIVDDFLAYRAKRDEAYKRIVTPAEQKHNDASDKRWNARDKLLTTPAPDPDAMLFKLELLAADMAEAAADDAERVAAIRDDAKRLFGELA